MTCGRYKTLLGLVVALCALLPICAVLGQQAQNVKPGKADETDPNKKNMRLVNVDDEIAGFLDKARDFIDHKAYDKAIDILQAVVSRPDAGFAPGISNNQYVSLSLKASEMINSMPPEGLKFYRSLYDPQAKQLYDTAVSTGDSGILRRVARQYACSSWGPAAMDLLGSIYFDSGRFFEAARVWGRLLQLNPDQSTRAMLLAKAAAANRLAGRDAQADAFVQELKKNFPQAKAVLGGSERNVVEFVETFHASAASQASGPAEQRGWAGWPAVPDGIASMDDCDVVLVPRWRNPPDTGDDLKKGLANVTPLLTPNQNYGNNQGPTSVKVQDGQVLVNMSMNGRRSKFQLPALVHPLVYGEVVLVRTDTDVTAYDTFTGEEAWKSLPLPMERSLKSTNQYYPNYSPFIEVDQTRYMPTLGDGRIYVLFGYPGSRRGNYNPFPAGTSGDDADTCALAALSLAAQGRMDWQVGNGIGTDDVVKNGKFVSPPTFASGRLYVVSLYMSSYHLLCLNAATGSLLWDASISQTPVQPNAYGMGSFTSTERCSAPAVSDGRAYVLTNSGVIVAVDADSGQGIWARQYQRQTLNGEQIAYRRNSPFQLAKPADVVIVARGRIVCMPSDSANIMALAAEDGSVLWEHTRDDQTELSAVGEDRILLSGPGLSVLSSADGKQIWSGEQINDINGRPAVGARIAFASGNGKLYRVNLDNYSVSTIDMADQDGLLGNLVSVDGRLIAANAIGVCASFAYDDVRARMDEKLSKAADNQAKAMIKLQTGQFAFNARKFSAARDDFQAALEFVKGEANSLETENMVRPWQYRTYVSLANTTSNMGEMKSWFDKAAQCAQSDTEKAYMQLRLGKYYQNLAEGLAGDEKLKTLKAAVASFQELGEKYPHERLADVKIGSGADLSVRENANASYSGEALAEKWIKSLIETGGQKAYEEYDAAAMEALQAATKLEDANAMLKVPQRWPNSIWADQARFAAAETLYNSAATASGEQARELLKITAGQLRIVRNMTKSPLRIQAEVALAATYYKLGRRVDARLSMPALRRLPQETPIVFASIRGELGQVLKEIENLGAAATAPGEIKYESRINSPLAKAFTIADESALLLRDQKGQPVRIGENLFVVKGGRINTRLDMIDVTGVSDKDCIRWESLPLTMTARDTPYGGSGRFAVASGMLGGLSKDQSVLVVADRASLVGFDVLTGRVQWAAKPMSDIGISNMAGMSVGDGVLVACDGGGKVVCVDIATGRTLWDSRLDIQQGAITDSPIIAGGYVMFRHSQYKKLSCIGIGTGKLVAEWSARTLCDGDLTESGLAAVIVDGQLSICDANRQGETLITRKYDPGQQPRIIAVSGDFVAVTPSLLKPAIDLFSIRLGDKQEPLRLATSNAGGQSSMMPVRGQFDGDKFYVFCTNTNMINGNRMFALGGANFMLQGLNLQRFVVGDGKTSPQWTWTLSDSGNEMFIPRPLEIGRDNVVVMGKSANNPAQWSRAALLDCGNGKSSDVEIETADKNKQDETNIDPAQMNRVQSLGTPAMTDGRLIVETSDGIDVYAGK